VICAVMGECGEPTRQTHSFITHHRHQSQSTEIIALNLVLTEDTNPELRASECTVNSKGQELRHCSGSDRTGTAWQQAA